MKRAANIQQNVKTAESLTFGRILAAPQPLSKFNTCSWHSACTIFGGSDIFATLSLSLIAQTRAYTGQKLAGARVNIRLFMQKCMGSLFVFYPHQ